MPTQTPTEVLKQLISDIDSTGGLIRFSDGHYAPKADPYWTDLGMTVKAAEEALTSQGDEVTLNIEDVEYASSDIDTL